MSSIRGDLHDNLLTRLNRLLQDTSELYEIAGLESHEATLDIFHALINTLAYATVELDLPIEHVFGAFTNSAEKLRKLKAKRAPRGAR